MNYRSLMYRLMIGAAVATCGALCASEASAHGSRGWNLYWGYPAYSGMYHYHHHHHYVTRPGYWHHSPVTTSGYGPYDGWWGGYTGWYGPNRYDYYCCGRSQGDGVPSGADSPEQLPTPGTAEEEFGNGPGYVP